MAAGPGNFLPGAQVNIRAVHGDLAQEVVQITVDRLTIILNDHVKNIDSGRTWIAPAGILFALVATFVTTSFKEAFDLSADTWKAVFILITFFVFAWLIFTLWHYAKKQSIADLVEKIKGQNKIQQ
jgi:hypothetical protein